MSNEGCNIVNEIEVSPFHINREWIDIAAAMSAAVDDLLAEFEGKYVRLTWPDKNIILDLTAFCERNIAISTHLSDMIVARIIDPATEVGHKLPIFYLIDAVMKHVGGPYPALFSRHLAEVFKRAFDEVARFPNNGTVRITLPSST